MRQRIAAHRVADCGVKDIGPAFGIPQSSIPARHVKDQLARVFWPVSKSQQVRCRGIHQDQVAGRLRGRGPVHWRDGAGIVHFEKGKPVVLVQKAACCGVVRMAYNGPGLPVIFRDRIEVGQDWGTVHLLPDVGDVDFQRLRAERHGHYHCYCHPQRGFPHQTTDRHHPLSLLLPAFAPSHAVPLQRTS